MKQFHLILTAAGAISVITGAASETDSLVFAGWVIAILSAARYLERRNRERTRRAQKEAETLRRKHENTMDTYQFSTLLTREQLMRDYDKIKL